eukprot:CAMPEP_0172776908 /NCGR_PEP_ID=MMETSP1074-20121228/200817_1 /TAXON_ID=2916 /ORGANISM="Ceratium fusus, Strain PA161109" /LENGTH=39 /DNA_ID= /DNA_START= /DNA_END= /DNA_ORIENTATION=
MNYIFPSAPNTACVTQQQTVECNLKTDNWDLSNVPTSSR